MIAQLAAEAAVERGLFAPGVKLFGQLRVIGRMREALLIGVDGAIDIAPLIQHVAQEKRRRRQRGLDLQRIDKKAPRLVSRPWRRAATPAPSKDDACCGAIFNASSNAAAAS